jgi:hypothetical protein
MSEILFHYQKIDPTTWVYVSSLLMFGLFFQFNRFWSVRNLDLILLILLAPGLLMVNEARDVNKPLRSHASRQDTAASAASTEASLHSTTTEQPDTAEPAAASDPNAAAATHEETDNTDRVARRRLAYTGYLWLFGISSIWLIRLLVDPTMIRRPLLEPNATKGCLVFLGCSLFLFLMANVITSEATPDDKRAVAAGISFWKGQDNGQNLDKPEQYARFGPGYYPLIGLPSIPTHPFIRDDHLQSGRAQEVAAKTMAITSHMAVVLALIVIGYWHFENVKMGIGAALLYLMLPYTAQMTGHVDHVLPAALLLWAVVLYRRPALAGILIGLAISVVYYPLFLLPLWLSFYRQRGLARFLAGVLGAAAVMVFSLVFVSSDVFSFWLKVQQMFALWLPRVEGLHGIWALGWDPWYRLPVIVACAVLAVAIAWLPSHKNLGTLLSCSAAIMVFVQFWHGFGDGGGMYMAWYLPLLLMTVFRPNLEDRVALSVLGEGWFTRRRARQTQLGRAA